MAYWWIESWRAHAVRRRESAASRLSHTVPLLIGIVLMVSPRWLPYWLSGRALPCNELTAWMGIAVMVVGLGISVWARRHLAGWWSSAVTLKQDHQLIRSGPYRWVRHPIYTGLLLGMLGTAIAVGEWHSFVSFPFIAAALCRKIAIEESFLRQAFPEDYERYRAEVPALIPLLR
ncbi:MAG: methyltransferase family protein [Stellaceae bacterium]